MRTLQPTGLTRITTHLKRFVPYGIISSGLLYLSTSPEDDNEDKWCIDPRGVLTLCVTKDTYERLGLVGEKLVLRGAPGGELHGAYILDSSCLRC